jgi:hypothetical protein
MIADREEFDRLVARAAIWREYGAVVERRADRALLAAEDMAAPRLRLVDESRRTVRVLNAPAEARSRPPRILRHYFDDTLNRQGVEPVGVYIGRSCERDLDYRIVRTAAGDDLLAMLRDEVEPSVFMPGRQPRAGAIETTFER